MVIANFRLFYKRLIKFCKKKNSKFILYFISFIESIFFPLPTDPFLIPFVIAEKKIFYKYSFCYLFFCFRWSHSLLYRKYTMGESRISYNNFFPLYWRIHKSISK